MKTGEVTEKETTIEVSDTAAILALLNEQKKKIAEMEAKLASGQQVNIQDIVIAAVKGVKEGDKAGITRAGGMQASEIPKDDFDEKGVVFCHPSSGFIVTDYYKNGFRVVPPYGIPMIEFELKASKRRQHGKEFQIHHICMYRSQSKAVTKFLREDPNHNVSFYESMKTMESIDVRKAVLTAKLMNTLRDWDTLKIIKSCGDFGVARHDDIDTMRQQLVLAMIDRDHKAEQLIIATRVNDSAKEALLMKSNVDIIK